MDARQPLTALLALLVLAACAGQAPDGIYFPRRVQPSDGTSMAALLSGTLIERDGCIFVESDVPTPSGKERTMRSLVIWPHEARLVRGEAGSLVITGQSRA